jgi:hypothetical protein
MNLAKRISEQIEKQRERGNEERAARLEEAVRYLNGREVR